MQEKELMTYEEQEQERVASLLYELEGVKYFTIRDFFKELRLSSPYTRLNIHPFWIGLPFYKTLIFDLHPFQSEQILLQGQGVTVNQLLSLQEEGKIQIILSGPPKIYQGLDYLDPILRLNPPSYSYRLSAYVSRLHGFDTLEDWRAEGAEIFGGKLGKLFNDSKVATEQDYFEKTFISAWVNVRALNLHSVAEAIKLAATRNPYAAGVYLELFHEMACAPITTCLKGCHSIPADYIDAATFYLRNQNCDLNGIKKYFKNEFNQEIGRLLIDRYRLIRPRTLSNALEVYPDYNEARLALKALSEFVEENSPDHVDSAAKAVSKAFEDVYKIKSRKKKFETAFQVTGIVGSASLGLTGNVTGLLGAIGFGLLGAVLAPSIAETVSKLNISNSVVTLYDFDGKVTDKWH